MSIYVCDSCKDEAWRELKQEFDKAIALLLEKKGYCWCEVGVGNPMMGGEHSSTCDKIAAFLREQGIAVDRSLIHYGNSL